MIFKREEPGGASAGGLLIKGDGFEGFKSLKNDLSKNESHAENREPSEFERLKMEEMRQNDDEIEGLIGNAIEKLDRLDLHAQDINVEVRLQAKKLK